jgi:hypothetical protein
MSTYIDPLHARMLMIRKAAPWVARPLTPIPPATPGVCRNRTTFTPKPTLHPTGPIPKASEWARQALGFQPSPKQAEALDLDPQRMILNCARQWGKSTVIALKALHTAVFQPNKTIIVLSASEYQGGLLIQKVGHNAASLGYQTRRLVGRRFSLEFENGSKILAISHNARTGVGHTADVLIIDEAAHVKDDVVAAIMPTLARTNGKVWMLSTPAGQEGLFYRIWHNDAGYKWVRIKATIEDTAYATPEFIEEQKILFPLHAKRDFYCEFMPPQGRMFSRELVEKMLDPTIPAWQFEPVNTA